MLLTYLFHILHFTLHVKRHFSKNNSLHWDEENNIYINCWFVTQKRWLMEAEVSFEGTQPAGSLITPTLLPANSTSAFRGRKTQHVLKTQFRGKDNEKILKTRRPHSTHVAYGTLLSLLFSFTESLIR